MSNRQPPRDEFAQMIGEQTPLRGDPNVTGLGPPPTNAPAGIAPPSPLQVQSVFDTRPLAAYDFALTQTKGAAFSPEAPTAEVFPLTLPQGFTAVLRRIRIECTPGFQGDTGYTGDIMNSLLFQITRDGATIPNNAIRFGTLQDYTWETHQVFGFWQTLGMRIGWESGLIDPATGLNYDFRFTYMGTLIPTKGLPPSEEIGSDPVIVRLFHNPRAR